VPRYCTGRELASTPGVGAQMRPLFGKYAEADDGIGHAFRREVLR